MPESKTPRPVSAGRKDAPVRAGRTNPPAARQGKGAPAARQGKGAHRAEGPNGRSRGKKRPAAILANRAWVPPTFIAVGLLGVLWLVLYYIAGVHIPGMRELGGWNIVIGMGLMAASFGIATLWT